MFFLGNKIIIVHAGNEEGFIRNADLVFKPNQKTEDYHDNMNFDNYSKWGRKKII